MLELMKGSTTAGLIEYHFSVPQEKAESITNAIRAVLEMAKSQYAEKDSVESEKTFSIEDIYGAKNPGRILRGFRNREGLTQKDLASGIGTKQHVISELENGSKKITQKMAERLASYFDTVPSVFL